jgi:arginyl-tRNA synthetase
MSTIADHLTDLVRTAATKAGLADSPVPLEPCVPTNNPEHGDYQSNYAFRLAKAARSNPRAVAQQLVDALPDDPALAEVSVAGPGFVNLRLSSAWLADDLKARAGDARLGGPMPGDGKTVVIDYSSPNIAKRMHVGHLRSTVIGGALDRLHRYLGWNVVADNHIGDWGTQFGKLIVGWHGWRDDAAYEADAIGELQRIYQLFAEKSDADASLIEQARAETAKLQAGDPENVALWQQFIDASMKEFDGVYERLGIHFDVVHGESFYNDALTPLVDELLSKGIAEVSDGAVVVPFTGDDGKGLAKNPLLIRKSDGAFLYGTTDLATIRHRTATWAPDLALYVVDKRQQLHFRQVFAAAKKMGSEGTRFVHVWFGTLLVDGAAMSSRKGSVINLVDLLDTAAERAYGIVTERSPELPEAERRDIAEAIAVGTIKYFDLSQNPQSDIDFTWNKALSLDGGSAVYLMYAYARLHKMLRDEGVADGVPNRAPSLEHPAERTLGLLAARVPEAAQAAADTFRPNLLAEHLDALASAVGPFYNACPVRKEPNPEVKAGRLALVHAVTRALEVGLGLLGIPVVERM